MHCFVDRTLKKNAIPLIPISTTELNMWLAEEGSKYRNWVKGNGYKAESGEVLLLPSSDTSIQSALIGVDENSLIWSWGGVPQQLPAAEYVIQKEMKESEANAASLGWALGCYHFSEYLGTGREQPRLVWPENTNKRLTISLAEGIYLTRDLINTPANDMNIREYKGTLPFFSILILKG